MKRPHLIVEPALAIALVSAVVTGFAQIAPSNQQVTTMVPLQDVVERALVAYPGRLLEAEPDQEGGRNVYALKITDANGQTRELHYDVFTGELLKVQEEHDNVYALRRAGHILPLSEILKRAQRAHPGELLEADLDEEDSHLVYELEMASEDGLDRELYLDAKTGELLRTELDD